MIPTADPRGVHAPRLQGDVGFWYSAINMVQAQFERVGSVSDFTKGVSPTRPNAPDTARATLAMISNAQVAFDWKTADFTESYKEEFRHVHELHARNLKEPVSFEFFNRNTQAFETRNIEPEVFQSPVEFEFILNPSRAAEQQTNQALFSMLGQTIVAANGGDPNILRPLAKDLWESHGKDNFEEIWPTPQPIEVTPGMPQGGAGPQGPGIPQGQAPAPGNGNVPGGLPVSGSLQDLFRAQQGRPEGEPVLDAEDEGANLSNA